MIKRLKYRTQHDHTPGEITDVFDGSNYLKMLNTFVDINGSRQAHKYFSDPQDIAFGGSTDGFQVPSSLIQHYHSYALIKLLDICYQAGMGQEEKQLSLAHYTYQLQPPA
jgi:hypothetical protein